MPKSPARPTAEDLLVSSLRPAAENPRKTTDDRLTFVTAYCDASGTTAPAKFFTLAGWIGEADAWTEVGEGWAAALGPEVDAFHMKEFAHSVGQFKGWTEDRRRELMGSLLEVLCIDPRHGALLLAHLALRRPSFRFNIG